MFVNGSPALFALNVWSQGSILCTSHGIHCLGCGGNGLTWVSSEQRPLNGSACGFCCLPVGNLRVHVCFWEACIVCNECMEPTISDMYFNWFSMFRVWWEWAHMG